MEWTHRVGTLLVAGALLLPLPSLAQAPVDDPAVAAAEASQIRDRYCLDASNAVITLEAEGTAQVSAVWARVSRSYDSNKEAYLLYWRALLGQCIDKVDRVQQDLEAFIAAVGEDPAYTEQVRDARRRLQRLAVQTKVEVPPPDSRVGIGVGIGVAVGGGVLGALSGWQGAEMRTLGAEYHSGRLFTEQYADQEAAVVAAETASNALLASAVVTGAAGLTLAIVSAGVSSDQQALVLPTPGGVMVAVRW